MLKTEQNKSKIVAAPLLVCTSLDKFDSSMVQWTELKDLRSGKDDCQTYCKYWVYYIIELNIIFPNFSNSAQYCHTSSGKALPHAGVHSATFRRQHWPYFDIKLADHAGLHQWRILTASQQTYQRANAAIPPNKDMPNPRQIFVCCRRKESSRLLEPALLHQCDAEFLYTWLVRVTLEALMAHELHQAPLNLLPGQRQFSRK